MTTRITRTPGADEGAASNQQLSTINPLIGPNPDETQGRVNVVLGFLAEVFRECDGTTITSAHGWGISLIIDTCCSALDNPTDAGGAA